MNVGNRAERLAFELAAGTHNATDASAHHTYGVRSVCQYRRNIEGE